jgi:hypothetical protein
MNDDMSLEEFDAFVERAEAVKNSILYQALKAARVGAIQAYRAKMDEVFGDDSAARTDYVGAPEHKSLLVELDAAEKQIEDWMKALRAE